ncbi:hypothetical protein CEXT_154551 [Caerostris extrusa]|uniref:Uncharacterized protein n=1 Tax=Caerostris extrusa TaxID=172846 RepID=A0AAV4M711_CAEEX|nr:hypothetical protein CEXT_154551 [Caerostris extrusa]
MQFLQGRLIVSILAMIITVCVCRVMSDDYTWEDERLRHNKCEELLPECKCHEYYWRSVDLTCQNVSDFETFDHILSNDSVFVVNTTFDITLSGNTVLPKRVSQWIGS